MRKFRKGTKRRAKLLRLLQRWAAAAPDGERRRAGDCGQCYAVLSIRDWVTEVRCYTESAVEGRPCLEQQRSLPALTSFMYDAAEQAAITQFEFGREQMEGARRALVYLEQQGHERSPSARLQILVDELTEIELAIVREQKIHDTAKDLESLAKINPTALPSMMLARLKVETEMLELAIEARPALYAVLSILRRGRVQHEEAPKP